MRKATASLVMVLTLMSAGCITPSAYVERHMEDVTEVWGVWDEEPFRYPADSEEGRPVAEAMLEMVHGVQNIMQGGVYLERLHDAPPDFVVLELREGTVLDLPNDERDRAWTSMNVTWRASESGTLYPCGPPNEAEMRTFCSDWGTETGSAVLGDAFGRPAGD